MTPFRRLVSYQCCLALLASAFAVQTLGAAVDSGEEAMGLDDIAPSLFKPSAPPARIKVKLEKIANGLEQPIFLTARPGHSQLYVVERKGCVQIVENGDVLPTPFLDLRNAVDWAGERGLLGLAFDPAFDQTRRCYVCYSDKKTLATVVVRYTADAAGLAAQPKSREEILRIPQPPEFIDHKAGWIGFRPGEPRYLYLSTGDGGGANDVHNNAQSLKSRLGKILRLDVSGKGPGFKIPKGNPFIGRKDALPEIWACGLRNPFRPSFDRETSDMYIGDVGQDAREEVNYEHAGTPGGRNYGWRLMEGLERNQAVDGKLPRNLVKPLIDYPHSAMMVLRGCVIGGYVYRGAAIPELQGAYFFSDFPNARIFSLRHKGQDVTELTDWTDVLNFDNEHFCFSGMPSFGEDGAGELCLLDFQGAIYRLVRAE